MDFHIEPGSNDLIITVSKHESAQLKAERASNPEFHSDNYMYDTIETVWTNGLSCSIRPEDVGALTDAPMLCEYNDDDGAPKGKVWAYMDYQVRSVLDDLADKSEARWTYVGEA